MKTEETKPTVETVEEVEKPASNENGVLLKYEDVIRVKKAKGAIEIKGLDITRAKYSVSKTGTQIVTITVDGCVQAMRANPLNPGVFERSVSRSFIVTLISLTAAISHNPEIAFLVDILNSNPEKVSLLLPGGKISVLQTSVEAGDEYYNDFSGKTNTVINSTYYTDVEDIQLGKMGTQAALMLFEKKVNE